MNKEIQLELKLETSRLILLAGEQVFSYKETIKDEMLNSVNTLKDWVAFFNYQFDEYKVTDFLNKSTDTQYNKEYFRYFIFEKDTMQFVGSVVLQDIDLRLPSCEIGYWAVNSGLGKGYITEAIQYITQHVIENHGFVRIEAYIDVKNTRSINTIERCEYEREGTLKNSDLSADQQSIINEALYAITTPVYFK
ncbi:GNAT family N-acetyltransferase [Mammaliicoccus sciuri]|uniref:GNAT family N-acetyltransferase n=1 Tax=Mammaliicoccus sciuri TaxID=1296 RepID=UPI001FB3DA8F|nr:GNAT family N-acetyltransferase [Mammaliicoccus sciuri]MCJ0920395.1 GNAT family N-acetyltransferase [Mammaliicoccus sciuri]MCJ0958170.1 GNAT family N-acetyltransferase [Mammaliicoccus sciuri]MCJ0963172.1 GNAT family N-acetyltransferase [Mammaliicoccus sciuri]MCJ1776950.1 GNAT family N-acetyltransferase [Mammaliicoccus sciuri]MDC5693636.1 GNAT family N-acetyltransferase [Mammaliicoccus sciuri]